MHGINSQKKFINNLINHWWMQSEEVAEKGGGHIEHLI